MFDRVLTIARIVLPIVILAAIAVGGQAGQRWH